MEIAKQKILMEKGAIDISGLLNAGNINLDLRDKCEINEIGGAVINVKRSKHLLLKCY